MLRLILRFLALLLLALFILAFPVSLVMRAVGGGFFDPQTAKSLVHDTLRSSGWVNSLVLQGPRQIVSGNGDALADSTKVALSYLSEEDWTKLSRLVAPEKLVDGAVDQVVDSFVRWLNDNSPFPDIQIGLKPWKEQAGAKSEEIAALILSALPACDQTTLTQQTSGQLQAALPVCMPPETMQLQVQNQAGSALRTLISSAPDSIDLASLDNGSGPVEMTRLKADLVRTRSILQWTWLGVLCAGLMAAALASASGRSFFGWMGWSLIASGVLLLIFSVGLYLFSMNFVNVYLAALLKQTPGITDTLGNAISSGVLTHTRNAVSAEGLLAVLLGSASIYYSRIRHHRVLSPGIPIRRWKIGL